MAKGGEGDVGEGGGGGQAGVVGEEGFDGGALDAGGGEVEGDGLGLGGEVHGDDRGGFAGSDGAEVGEDVGVGGVEHGKASVMEGVVGAAKGDEALVPVEKGVRFLLLDGDVDGLVVGGDGEPGFGGGGEAGILARVPLHGGALAVTAFFPWASR